MLLGCCHCGDPPSESDSIPPSESVISSEESIETIVGNCGNLQRCLNDTVPLSYNLEVIRPGPYVAVCQPFYEGSFTLFYNPNFCFQFNSAERAKRLVGASCVDETTHPRWRLNIGGGAAGTSMGLQALYIDSGFLVSVANYAALFTPGNINCVSSFTLNLVRSVGIPAFGWSFPETVSLSL
jgi:hypothetical protein